MRDIDGVEAAVTPLDYRIPISPPPLPLPLPPAGLRAYPESPLAGPRCPRCPPPPQPSATAKSTQPSSPSLRLPCLPTR